jgi:hypothetical protein
MSCLCYHRMQILYMLDMIEETANRGKSIRKIKQFYETYKNFQSSQHC